ncbi:MAG: glycosyltransferase family 39 protein [Opitutaceae bacterium]|nr:glycosyltransferase family 39 protein [Opitutaceae bacterium]
MGREPRASPGFLVTVAVLLAGLHAVLAVTATVDKSMTADEIAHLTAGHAYNVRGDFRMQPENGNLPQRLAALPLGVARVALPDPNTPSWRRADIWNYGHTFFYESGMTVDWWLFLGRGMIALVSAATGLLIFAWSRALFGWTGGFVSLALFVCSPTFLAHGALATSDVVMTFFFLASVGAWWRHLEHPGALGAALSAVVFGLSFVAKFSAVLLGPMLALCALGWALGAVRTMGRKLVLARLIRTTAVHAVTAWAIIWMFYGLRFAAFAPELAADASFNHGWGFVLTGLGRPAPVIAELKDWHVLPEAWMYGFTFVLQFARARGAFLNGEYSFTGWAHFFPFAFLVKSTVPLLLLTGGVVVMALRKPRAAATAVWIRYRSLIPLAALFVVYWLTSVGSNLNIGHRHILPTYPVLFIAAGWVGQALTRRPLFVRLAVAAAVVWQAAESWRIRPHYLAYFNQIVGGPANGWRHLVDSSLDWGQDLPTLKVWLDRHAPGEKVYLSYFGTGEPAYEGIKATALPTLPQVGPPRPWHRLTGGVYAVSATMLQHVYSTIRGEWTLKLEREYQELRTLEPTFLAFQTDGARRAELLRDMPQPRWAGLWQRYELLRFARLCYCLRARQPDGIPGYSILVYRLTDAEVRAATAGSLGEWAALIEKTSATNSGREARP